MGRCSAENSFWQNKVNERRGSVTKVVTIQNLLSDQLTVTIEKLGGADRDRTDDLLNAIRFQFVTVAYQKQ